MASSSVARLASARFACCVSLLAWHVASAIPFFPSFRFAGPVEKHLKHLTEEERGFPPVKENCSEHFYDQRLDHFGRNSSRTTFRQRYFLCSNIGQWSEGDPVFLYVGNEADVELYLNATGLMWESAPAFNARLIFVEHRYFGKSLPEGEGNLKDGKKVWEFLSADQAIADYVSIISMLRREILNTTLSPIVGFGGSYGGMLCAWLRISSPWSLDACLAASAPIFSFMGLDPPADPNFFAKITTRDASEAGGSPDSCHERIHSAWQNILDDGAAEGGPAALQASFRLCSSPASADGSVWDLIFWLSSAFDYMAMGSYPYSSSYILNGRGVMPPYPLREACKIISAAEPDKASQYAALREAVAIFYNASNAAGRCFNTSASGNKETTEDNEKWGYLYCSEMFQVFGKSGSTDMYWSSPWNVSASQESCWAQYKLWPDPDWVSQRYGGRSISRYASRIIFSNGALDPWSGGGATASLAPELPAVVIPEVGHHIDLFWSREDDTPALREARTKELAYLHRWVAEARAERARQFQGQEPTIVLT